MILDIGCGSNIYSMPLKVPGVVHADLQKTRYNKTFLNLQCSIYHLPLKDNSFNLCYCSHVLEHLLMPWRALKEIKRVCERAIIKVPNLRATISESKGHIYTWSQESFFNLLTLVYTNVKIETRPFKSISNLPFLSRSLELIFNYLFKRELTAYVS